VLSAGVGGVAKMTKNVALNKRRFMRRSVAACAGAGLTVLKLSGFGILTRPK
jgi:hypothetical protein